MASRPQERCEMAGRDEAKIVEPPPVHNALYHAAGAAILILNKIRHAVRGYRRPRPFSSDDFDAAHEYELRVVDEWRRLLSSYAGDDPFAGRRVLELGPGPDLGTGVILLAEGAESYTAVDAHELAAGVPAEFYERLLRRLEALDRADPDAVRRRVGPAEIGRRSPLRYVHRPDFDLCSLQGVAPEVVVSQAAFEHFDDVPGTIGHLGEIAAPGAAFLAVVDLATHTRWIRERDPLNIYRYGPTFYGATAFRGSPNRVRPEEYRRALADAGWERIRVVPLEVLEEGYVDRVRPGLSRRFRSADCRMEELTVAVMATHR